MLVLICIAGGDLSILGWLIGTWTLLWLVFSEVETPEVLWYNVQEFKAFKRESYWSGLFMTDLYTCFPCLDPFSKD